MTKVKVGAGLQFVAVLIADVLNPLFVMSLAVFASAGYILTLLMPVTIDIWQAVLWVSLVAPGLGLWVRFYARWKRGGYVKGGVSWRMLLPFIPLLVLAQSLIIEFSKPSLQIVGHGDLYSGYMQQLFYGATPIESYYMAGYPVNHYWLYFAYVAAVAKVASWPLLYASEIVNFIALFSGLLWLARVVILLGLARPRTIYLGLLVIFVYCSVNTAGMLSLLAHLVGGANLDLARSDLSMLLLEGADFRLHSILGNILSASSLAASLAAFCAVLWVCVRMIKGVFGLFSLVLISAGGLASMAAQPVTALYVLVLLVGLAVTAAIYGLTGSNRMALASVLWHEARDKISPAALLLWLVLSLAPSLLLLKYIRDFSYNYQAGFELFHPTNLSMIGAALVLLLPFFLCSVCLCLVRRDALRWFIVISAGLALCLTSGLQATDHNQQYKGVFPTGMLVALSGLFILGMMQGSRQGRWRRAGWLLAGLLLALTLPRMIFVNLHHVSRTRVVDRFEYEGLGWRLRHANRTALVYYWIRGHTPFNSIIAVDPDLTGINRYSNVLHERMLYVKRAPISIDHLVDGIPGYEERIRELKLFYSGEMNADEYQGMLARMIDSLPGRPLYAVVKDGEGSSSPQAMEERGAVLVYDGGQGVNVYRLNPGAGRVDDES